MEVIRFVGVASFRLLLAASTNSPKPCAGGALVFKSTRTAAGSTLEGENREGEPGRCGDAGSSLEEAAGSCRIDEACLIARSMVRTRDPFIGSVEPFWRRSWGLSFCYGENSCGESPSVGRVEGGKLGKIFEAGSTRAETERRSAIPGLVSVTQLATEREGVQRTTCFCSLQVISVDVRITCFEVRGGGCNRKTNTATV